MKTMAEEGQSVDGFLAELYRAPVRQRQAAILAAQRALKNNPIALLVNQAEASRLFGVSRYTLWRWARDGLIQPVVIRGVRRYRLADLEKLAVEGAQ